MSEFARRRRIARIAVSFLALALIAVLWLDDPEHKTAQAIAAGVAVLAVLAQRLSWRCPSCGLPPSAVPWGAPADCRRCGEALR